MSPTYPLTLDVAGRSTVVVGGGPVAARRARGLLDAGAIVQVVAPWVCEDLADLVADPALDSRVGWTARDYAAGDLEGAWIVHTATGDRPVDDAVARDAEAARVWCVRADDAEASSAWVPAVARTDDGVVVTCTGPPKAFDPAVPVRDQTTACHHRFAAPTRDLTIDTTATWRLTWSATNGTTGDLGTIDRTTTTPYRVQEKETVIRTGT